MRKFPPQCSHCGNLGNGDCATTPVPSASCDSFQSWSEHWTQEMASIEKALHNTYVAAAFFVVLAAITVLLPITLGH